MLKTKLTYSVKVDDQICSLLYYVYKGNDRNVTMKSPFLNLADPKL